MLLGMIIYFILGILGICQIMRFSELLTPIRSRSPFIDALCSCSMCCGVWASLIALCLFTIHPYMIIPFAGSFICSKLVTE
jgi:hypothetical protein